MPEAGRLDRSRTTSSGCENTAGFITFGVLAAGVAFSVNLGLTSDCHREKYFYQCEAKKKDCPSER
jgi:hypothetical protein